MLFMGTVLTFVVLVLYAFVYSNYRRNIRRYMAEDLRVPGCYFYETDSDDSEDEVFEQGNQAGDDESETKISVLERFKDQ